MQRNEAEPEQKRHKTQVTIDYSGSRMTDIDAKAIANTITQQAWNLPYDLIFSSNRIGNEGLLAIMSAILAINPAFPVNCNFFANQVDDAGIAALMNLLLTTPHPRELTLDLTGNPIGQQGLKSIYDAYKLGRFSQEFIIRTCSYSFGEWHTKINTVRSRNSMRFRAVLQSLTFLLGTRSSENAINILSRDVLLLILAEVYPFQSSCFPNGKSEKTYFANRVFSFFCSLPKPSVILSAAKDPLLATVSI